MTEGRYLLYNYTVLKSIGKVSFPYFSAGNLEAEMKKGKAITLLSIVCVILAFVLVMTFASFPVGVKDYNSVLGAIELDYDIAGGSAYTLTLARDNSEDVTDVNEVLKTLRSRLDDLGYRTYSVTALKPIKDGVEDYDIRICTVTTDSVDTDISAIASYGVVELYAGQSENPTDKILENEKIIENASYVGEGTDSTYQVLITFTQTAYDEIIKGIDSASSSSASYYLTIKLGDTELLKGSSAISKDYFSGRSLVVTSSSEVSAKQLAMQMRTGGLAYKYDVSDRSDVTPVLGENTKKLLVITVSALFVLISVAFVLRFKGYGIIAILSLLTFILAETAMLIAVPGIRLSLAGVLGIMFSMILASDGLFIIAKRISEEGAHGKTAKASVKTGFARSLFPILNSNVVAGIVALALFALVGGTFKCFAITFGIGVVISFICSILISRMFTSLILPLVGNPEKFLNIRKTEENV